MAKSEGVDSVRDERPFGGVHILATAVMCANGASDAEVELAGKILQQDPKRDAPRESESIAGAFNRHMDAAIGSVDRSRDELTRVSRRATLAHDLDRAGLVLMDRDIVAALMIKIGELKDERTEALLAAGGCSMSLPEAIEHLKEQLRELDQWDGNDDNPAPLDLGAELLLDEDQPLLVTVAAASTELSPGIQISPSCSISVGVIDDDDRPAAHGDYSNPGVND